MNIVIFAIICGLLAFIAALAVQMRIMVALVLRRALAAWNGLYVDRVRANEAVVGAASDTFDPAAADGEIVAAVKYLRAEYPLPLAHLKLARRASVFVPLGLLLAVICGRVVFEVV